MKIVVAACLVAIPSAYAAPKLSIEAHVDERPQPDSVDEITSIAATASSSLCDGKKNCYDAKQLVDDKLDTAWCEGAKGDGEGSTITLALAKAEKLDAIFIVPHYAKDFARATDNNRLAKVEIATDGGTGTVELPDVAAYVKKHNAPKETDGGDLDTLSRDDRIKFGTGVRVDLDTVTTKTVTLTIKSVYRGSVHDTCASEIHLYRAK